MRHYFAILLLLACTICHAQAHIASPRRHEAGTVVSTSSGIDAAAQADVWQAQIAQQPADANAWLNYYIWTSRDKSLPVTEKAGKLTAIVARSSASITTTPQYHLMVYLQSDKKDSASMHQVMEAADNKLSCYPYIIEFCIRQGNDSAAAVYCQALEAASPLPAPLYQYYYNALMSANKNAVIYAKGINDLVPMAIVQQVHNVRKDVQLEMFEGTVKTGDNVYLSVLLGKDILTSFANAGYTGLLIKTGDANTIGELEQHVLNDFNLTYLDMPGMLPGDIAPLYKNYLPSLLLLYHYFKSNNDERAGGVKIRIEKIAAGTGTFDEIQDLMK